MVTLGKRTIYKGKEYGLLDLKEKGSAIYTKCRIEEKYWMTEYNRYKYFLYVELSEVDEIAQKWTPLKLSKQ